MKKSARFKLSLSLTLMVMLLSTSIYAMSLPNKVLNTNSRGEDVVSVQKALNSIGAKLVVDGIYGNGTRQAVLNFQKTQYALKDDGIYGPATKTLLEKAVNEGNTGDQDDNDDDDDNSQIIVLPNKVVPFMSRGADVMNIQKALNKLGYKLATDGIYGRGTRQAIVNFQKTQYTLANDGIYGPATKVALDLALKAIAK